jgi:hypothetical protein
MAARMKSRDRRQQLITIMNEKYRPDLTQSEFTSEMIAKEANVSATMLYRLIGEEFKELRATLPGPRRSPRTVENDLRRIIKELMERVRQLEEELKASRNGKAIEETEMYEGMEAENRMLRGRVKILERRLKESELVIIPETEDEIENEDSAAEYAFAANGLGAKK